MKKIYFILLSVLLISCGPNRFIVSNNYKNTINVVLKSNSPDKRQVVYPKESKVFKSRAKRLVFMAYQNGEYFGAIHFDNVNKGKIDKYGNKLPYEMGVVTSANMLLTNKEKYKGVDIYYIEVNDKEVKNTLKGETSYLKLTSNEDNVQIYFDGEQIGEINNGIFNKKVLSGKHKLMAKKDFFMPITINLNLKPNDVFPYHFELKNVKGWIEEKPDEAKTEQARGDLTVVTERNDLKVYIEGFERTPPFDLEKVPAGIYNIKIVGPNFTKVIEVIVEESKKTFIDLDKLI